MKSTIVLQQLAYRGWHRVNRQEELLIGGVREGVGHGRAEGLSAIGDGGQAAISLTPEGDGTGSGPVLDSILSTLLKKRSSDVWVVVLFFSLQMTW